MLPGFRFLFAAVVLTTSMLIFGLGAAALLRAAHEEFASLPSRRVPLEPTFAQRSDDQPTLAMIRAEPAADRNETGSPATGDAVTIAALEQATAVSPPAEPENAGSESDEVAAPNDVATPAENSSPSDDVPKPEASTSEIPIQAEAPAGAPSPPVETTVAALAETTPNPVAVTEQPAAPVDDSTRLAETKIATLGGPPVPIETKMPSKVAPVLVKKNVQARRVIKRKIAQRPRTASPPSRQPANPFGTPFGT